MIGAVFASSVRASESTAPTIWEIQALLFLKWKEQIVCSCEISSATRLSQQLYKNNLNRLNWDLAVKVLLKRSPSKTRLQYALINEDFFSQQQDNHFGNLMTYRNS